MQQLFGRLPPPYRETHGRRQAASLLCSLPHTTPLPSHAVVCFLCVPFFTHIHTAHTHAL